jgi:hypothetical protein
MSSGRARLKTPIAPKEFGTRNLEKPDAWKNLTQEQLRLEWLEHPQHDRAYEGQ